MEKSRKNIINSLRLDGFLLKIPKNSINCYSWRFIIKNNTLNNVLFDILIYAY